MDSADEPISHHSDSIQPLYLTSTHPHFPLSPACGPLLTCIPQPRQSTSLHSHDSTALLSLNGKSALGNPVVWNSFWVRSDSFVLCASGCQPTRLCVPPKAVSHPRYALVLCASCCHRPIQVRVSNVGEVRSNDSRKVRGVSTTVPSTKCVPPRHALSLWVHAAIKQPHCASSVTEMR